MKKFYETPAVEFTGFNAEDVITTSTVTIDTTDMNNEQLNTFKAGIAQVADVAVDYSTYQW